MMMIMMMRSSFFLDELFPLISLEAHLQFLIIAEATQQISCCLISLIKLNLSHPTILKAYIASLMSTGRLHAEGAAGLNADDEG
jgi:hypothetical protein